jgi:hypothetical protein
MTLAVQMCARRWTSPRPCRAVSEGNRPARAGGLVAHNARNFTFPAPGPTDGFLVSGGSCPHGAVAIRCRSFRWGREAILQISAPPSSPWMSWPASPRRGYRGLPSRAAQSGGARELFQTNERPSHES